MDTPAEAEVALSARRPTLAAASTDIRDPGEASADARALSRDLRLTVTAAEILRQRGLGADDVTRRWLDPKLAHLTPPDAMIGRAESADRLARAVRARERIAIFGDYDCDGITSTAVITSVLRALGGEVVPLLATRREGSYGLSNPALERVLATGASVLVTCDCGSSDHERLATARSRGIDVVVIDHHLVPAEPLPAFAFLNPHRPECGFPYKGMASCGLALVLGAAVRKALGSALDLRPLLDLVAIGTIADVAPLDGDNRAMVRAGLSVLASGSPRPGLRALAENAKIDLSLPMRGEDIGFRIAPRLNAAGRLGDPDLALELLLEQSPATAVGMAATLEQVSLQRRALTEQMTQEAFADVDANGWADTAGLVVARQGWHPGIVGIVAGRLVTRYGRPAIVIALEGDRGRGSVRGPQGARLHDALTRCKADLVGFGGHQAAAGVDVHVARIDALRASWVDAFAVVPAGVADAGHPDVRLDPRDDPYAVACDLYRLEPCGERNRAPRLLLPGAVVRGARNLKGHLRLDVGWGAGVIGAFGFEMGPLAEALAGGSVDVVGQLRPDTWRGGDAVEMRIERVARRPQSQS